MSSLRDRFNQLGGRTRFVVCRLFVHLSGSEATPLLGVLNRVAREALEVEGELDALAAGLVETCQLLMQYDAYWQAAANEGDSFWDEGEAGDYVTELFTDSAQRYLSEVDFGEPLVDEDDPLFLAATRNLIVIITAAYEGEAPALETDLADVNALKMGLKALINLHHQGRLRAVQIHFSPAQLGDELTDEQVLLNFPELIPL